MNFRDLLPEVLYHSYVVEGDGSLLSFSLQEYLKEREGSDIEILYQEYDSMKIDDSRFVKDWHTNKSIEGRKRFCIISTKFIQREAEQAILKIIEEPNENTHFFIVIPNSSNLLDTIKSRVHIIKLNSKEVLLMENKTCTSPNGTSFKNENNIEKEAKEFLKASLKDRFEIIEKLVKAHKDEDTDSGGLRYHAVGLLNEIEKNIYEKLQNTKFVKENKEVGLPNIGKDKDLIKILEEIGEKRSYLNTPGAGVKMILEHIAIMLE